jgi:hypothetical protein
VLLLNLSEALWVWLDTSGWASNWTRETGDRILEIAVENAGSAEAYALLAVPWELLARVGDFLAAN